MRNYFIRFFHIAIIAAILEFLGCGYKAPPRWTPKKSEVNSSDLQIIDLNSTLKVKIGVK